MSPRRLHIGGQQEAEGWEIFDALERPEVDHVGNAKDLSRFPDNTFEALYASHVLEHFSHVRELLPVLREWNRVLRPGGTLHASVPDLDVLAELFLLRESVSTEERWAIQRMMFGGQIDDYDFHHAGLNQEFLSLFLRDAGFVDIRRVDDFGLFEDTSRLEFKGVPISCNMLARKPG